MATKKLKHSKMIWLNTLTVILCIATTLQGQKFVAANPKTTLLIGAVIAVANNVLRLITTKAIVFGFLILATCVSALGQTSEPARASYRVWVSEENSMSGGSSTGISPHLLVTNVHVVGRKGVTAQVIHPLLNKQWQGQVVATDRAADVALVFVSTGDLEWVELGEDPQADQPCHLLGYGGDSILKQGTGRFLGAFGHRENGVPVWDAAVESISGDSGGGLFDQSGRLVSVNWGGSDRRASASTPVSYVRALADRWASSLTPEQMQFLGGSGCFGGRCPPPGRGGVMPPKQPIQIGQQPQPKQPLGPINPPAPQVPQIDVDELTKKLAEKLAADPRLKGPPGPQGERGPAGDRGPPGCPGKDATIDYDALTAAVIDRLPPIHVQTFDRSGKLLDEESYPIGTPLKLRYGAMNEAR